MYLYKFIILCCLCLHVSAQHFRPTGPGVSSRYCSATNCLLPNCFCPSRRGPSHLQTHDIPQMVMLTFDDAVNSENIEFYRNLLNGKRLNPNGCPISATFFVSHDWTDYKMVRELYLAGHEIADHSISHRLPREWWRKATYRDWETELVGQRKNIASKSGVPKFEVRGVRVPFLELGGDTQFEVMSDRAFLYDSSFLTGPYNDRDWRLPSWPYTLEFYPELEFCDSDNCPKSNFSGIWEVPLNRWIGIDGQACSMVDGCSTQALQNKNDALRYLWKNFNRHFGKNRAPLGINVHADWFKVDYRFEAMQEFLDGILDLHDVYLVSVYQVIEWMRRPTSLSAITQFEPWLTCGSKRVLVQKRKHTEAPNISALDNGTDTTSLEDRKINKGVKRTRKVMDKRNRQMNTRRNETSKESKQRDNISAEKPTDSKDIRGYKISRTTEAQKNEAKKEMVGSRKSTEKNVERVKPKSKGKTKVEEIEVKRVPSDAELEINTKQGKAKERKPLASRKGHQDPSLLGKRGEFGNQNGMRSSATGVGKFTGHYIMISGILVFLVTL